MKIKSKKIFSNHIVLSIVFDFAHILTLMTRYDCSLQRTHSLMSTVSNVYNLQIYYLMIIKIRK